MFFAKGDTICNDTTELSVVEFNNILSTAFVVPALKPQEGSIQSRKPVKPKEVLEQLEKDNYYVSLPARCIIEGDVEAIKGKVDRWVDNFGRAGMGTWGNGGRGSRDRRGITDDGTSHRGIRCGVRDCGGCDQGCGGSAKEGIWKGGA